MYPDPNIKKPLPPVSTRRTTERGSLRYRKRKSTSRSFGWLLLSFIVLLFAIGWEYLSELKQWPPSLTVKEAPPITGLHPVVDAKQRELVEKTNAIGISILITDGYRSTEEQDAIYEQGRTSEGDIVTNARGGDSYHNYGLAIDFALITTRGEVVWDMEYDGNGNGRSDWMEVVEVAKQLGFTWGGDWANFPDYPHLQMDFGLTIRDLKRGKRPPEPEPETVSPAP